MSRVAEDFLFKFKAARNAKESFGVIEDMKSYLKKKKAVLDELLSEISSSKILIRFVAGAAASETRMSTKTAPATKVEITLKPADIKKIQTSWDVLVDYNATLKSLEDSILPQANQMYKNIKGLKEHNAMTMKFITECKKSRDAVLAGLQSTNSKHVPDQLTKLITEIKTKLETVLKGRFESCDFLLYPNVVELKGKHPLAFFCYIQFKGLEDDDGWRKEVFDIIVIAVKDEKTQSLQYQVHTDEEGHHLPNEISLKDSDWLGRIEGVENRVITHLTDQHSLNVLLPQTLPVTKRKLESDKSIQTAYPIVTDMEIVNNQLKLKLSPEAITNLTEAKDFQLKVRPLIKTFFNIAQIANNITGKAVPDGKAGFAILWQLDAPIAETTVKLQSRFRADRSALLELGKRLKLDSAGLHALEDSYKSHLFKQLHKIKPKGFPNTPEDAPGYTVDTKLEERQRKQTQEYNQKRALNLKVREEPEEESDEDPIPSDRTKKQVKKATPISKIKNLKLSKALEDEDIDL